MSQKASENSTDNRKATRKICRQDIRTSHSHSSPTFLHRNVNWHNQRESKSNIQATPTYEVLHKSGDEYSKWKNKAMEVYKKHIFCFLLLYHITWKTHRMRISNELQDRNAKTINELKCRFPSTLDNYYTERRHLQNEYFLVDIGKVQ